MNRKTLVRVSVFTICLLVLVLIFIGYPIFRGFAEEHLQVIREEVQDAIREAEKLSNEGKYAEALRLLFDAKYKEERAQLFLALKNDDVFPLTASAEILTVEKLLIHTDQSPLMQFFRKPNVPIQEKRAYIKELRSLATRKVQEGEEVRFRGQYQGTLVQLMTSPLLNQPEKFDVLFWIESTIQDEYTSKAQQHQIREEIAQLQTLAEQKFRAQQYVEAFILLTEAKQKARDIQLGLLPGDDYDSLLQQSADMRKAFVHADESPLMQMFKDRQIPIRKRQIFMYDLQERVANFSLPRSEKIVLQGEAYDGTLVQILTHPRVDWGIKHLILVSIDVEILEKESDYLPDWMWGDDEEFMKLWEEYEKGKEKMKNDKN